MTETDMTDTTTTIYSATFSCEDGGQETKDYGLARPDDDQIEADLREWIEGGEWGRNGASVTGYWSLEEDGDEIDDGRVTIEIAPDHDYLIRKATRGRETCGTSPGDHDWTSEGEGGCTENPGVWSTGGTSLTISSHCRDCGLRRTEYHCGSQRNPGQHDRTVYAMPE